MSIEYESVIYSGGNVSVNSPKGFATLHYDTTPSPLSVAGGGIAALTGEGGVLDGLEQIFGDIASGDVLTPKGFLGTAIKAINTYKQGGRLSKEGLKREAVNILSSPAGITAGTALIGGIAGAVFPKRNPANEPTNATAKPIVPPSNNQ